MVIYRGTYGCILRASQRKYQTQSKHKTKAHMNKLYSKGIRLSELMEKWRKRKKGHFTVYTKEGKRFVLPLDYLNHPILQVLLEMAEDEFGTTIDGPLKIPCDGSFMDHVIVLVRKSMSDKYDDDDDDDDDVVKKSEVCSTTTCKGASISSLIPLFRGQSQLRSLVS